MGNCVHTSLCMLDLSVKGLCHDGMKTQLIQAKLFQAVCSGLNQFFM